jgi:hypothetical protein
MNYIFYIILVFYVVDVEASVATHTLLIRSNIVNHLCFTIADKQLIEFLFIINQASVVERMRCKTIEVAAKQGTIKSKQSTTDDVLMFVTTMIKMEIVREFAREGCVK